jgi:DNA-binding transcriptional ArsR family regulator
MTSPDELDTIIALTPRVGPVAVVVFLDLVRHEDTATVASIGRRLGLGRDRVTHALVRLRDAGLVSVAQERLEGRFASTRYTTRLPRSVPSRPKRRAADNGTLPLFPESAAP